MSTPVTLAPASASVSVSSPDAHWRCSTSRPFQSAIGSEAGSKLPSPRANDSADRSAPPRTAPHASQAARFHRGVTEDFVVLHGRYGTSAGGRVPPRPSAAVSALGWVAASDLTSPSARRGPAPRRPTSDHLHRLVPRRPPRSTQQATAIDAQHAALDLVVLN
jgi:hypothetical protein